MTQAGDLLIVHNFDAIRRDLGALETKLFFIWAAAILAGIAISMFLARRVLQPIRELDQAAALHRRTEVRHPRAGRRQR